MKRLLGIDVGEARIGLALSDELGMLAHPLETVRAKAGSHDPAAVRHVAGVALREGVETAVVGLPRNMNGTDGPATAKVRAFAELLKKEAGALQKPAGDAESAPASGASPLTVKFWDERMTTVAAQRQLHEAGRNAKNSRAVIDQAAAVLILQGYLDSLGGMFAGGEIEG